MSLHEGKTYEKVFWVECETRVFPTELGEVVIYLECVSEVPFLNNTFFFLLSPVLYHSGICDITSQLTFVATICLSHVKPGYSSPKRDFRTWLVAPSHPTM